MKKIISIVLVVALCVAIAVPVSADINIGTTDVSLEARIQNDINELKEQVWADLYEQLAAQDALDGIEYFKEALYPEIVATVYSRYGVQPDASVASENVSRTYQFRNGGMVTYTGSLNTENVVLCMIPEQVEDYWKEMDEVTLRDYLISFIEGYLGWRPLDWLFFAFPNTLTEMAKQEIEAADNYARILAISWGSGAEYACYGYGWTTYPSCTITDVDEVLDVQYF